LLIRFIVFRYEFLRAEQVAKFPFFIISQYDEKTVNVYLDIDEGQKYYLRNVTWVGNTLYPSEQLDFLLRMKKGDVYNQKLLNEHISTDDDAIGNLYYNNGYLFYTSIR